MTDQVKTNEAQDKALELGKALTKYVPHGHSARLYIDMIKSQVLGVDKQGNQRPTEDLVLFMYVANRTGLDPLSKQIYAVYRWDSRSQKEKMIIQAGIDGLRTIAQRTGEYCGSDDGVFEVKDGKPAKASVTVYKLNKMTGERMPVTASARWDEYVQKNIKGEPMGMWGNMPYNQLEKCAESKALRKAFPNELASIYSEEEMHQAANVVLPAPGKKETLEATTVKSTTDVTKLRGGIQ